MGCIPDNAQRVSSWASTVVDDCKLENMQLLRNVQGVYSITISADTNKITISGTGAPKELLETLLKLSQNGDFYVNPPAHFAPYNCPANKSICSGAAGQCLRLPNNSCMRISRDPKTPCCDNLPRRGAVPVLQLQAVQQLVAREVTITAATHIIRVVAGIVNLLSNNIPAGT